jgi:peptidoglycan/xylan/chitin deacetylase (PgdA/CDA1 family)
MSDSKPFPVLLTFDLDGETAFEEMHPGVSYWVTQGGYGPRRGVYRILDLLDESEIKATFCVVGLTAERYPEAVEEIVSRGHEVACHGYTHRGYNALEPEEEREGIVTSRKILEEFTGERVVGHRTPRWRPSGRTHRLLEELGFTWNSDYMGADSRGLQPGRLDLLLRLGLHGAGHGGDVDRGVRRPVQGQEPLLPHVPPPGHGPAVEAPLPQRHRGLHQEVSRR